MIPRDCHKAPCHCVMPGGKVSLSREPQEAPVSARSVTGVSLRPHPGPSCLGPPGLCCQKSSKFLGLGAVGTLDLVKGPKFWALEQPLVSHTSIRSWARRVLSRSCGAEKARPPTASGGSRASCLCPALPTRALCLCPHGLPGPDPLAERAWSTEQTPTTQPFTKHLPRAKAFWLLRKAHCACCVHPGNGDRDAA